MYVYLKERTEHTAVEDREEEEGESKKDEALPVTEETVVKENGLDSGKSKGHKDGDLDDSGSDSLSDSSDSEPENLDQSGE